MEEYFGRTFFSYYVINKLISNTSLSSYRRLLIGRYDFDCRPKLLSSLSSFFFDSNGFTLNMEPDPFAFIEDLNFENEEPEEPEEPEEDEQVRIS